MVLNYRCPGCGADMKFDEKAGNLACEFCGTKMSVADAEATKSAAVTTDVKAEKVEQSGETMSVSSYRCPSCGAEIVTDDATAATFCSFCGSPTLMPEKLSGVKKPELVIPFGIGKEEAKEKFKAWTKKGLFTPEAFKNQASVDKITGVYSPAWLYNYYTDTSYAAKAVKKRKEKDSQFEYIYSDHYEVERRVTNNFERVPGNASEKLSEDTLETLEPFDYNKMTEFQMAYLSGYYAEQVQKDQAAVAPRVEKRVERYSIQAVEDTIEHYDELKPYRQQVTMTRKKAVYALLPLWLINYQYDKKPYLFAINGETGKISGALPTSKLKALLFAFFVFAASFGVALLISHGAISATSFIVPLIIAAIATFIALSGQTQKAKVTNQNVYMKQGGKYILIQKDTFINTTVEKKPLNNGSSEGKSA